MATHHSPPNGKKGLDKYKLAMHIAIANGHPKWEEVAKKLGSASANSLRVTWNNHKRAFLLEDRLTGSGVTMSGAAAAAAAAAADDDDDDDDNDVGVDENPTPTKASPKRKQNGTGRDGATIKKARKITLQKTALDEDTPATDGKEAALCKIKQEDISAGVDEVWGEI